MNFDGMTQEELLTYVHTTGEYINWPPAARKLFEILYGRVGNFKQKYKQ